MAHMTTLSPPTAETHGAPLMRRAADFRRPGPRAPYRLRRRPEERIRLLGALVDLVKPEEMLLYVDRKAALGEAAIIANHNSHSLHLLQREPLLTTFFDMADIIEVDSTPLLLWARLINGAGRRFHRCTYLDWRDAFWTKAAQRRWKVFYLGGAPGVADIAAQRISKAYPGVKIACRDGYFDAAAGSSDNAALVAQINAYAPDILFVGMGMPRQEAWIVLHQHYLKPCVTFSVGAAFDYEAGVQKAAPRWMGRLGVEWLFRLAHDPRRLFSRYLIEPWTLIGPALADLGYGLGRKLGFGAPSTDRRRAGDR
jgi:N-acetylglucosaminyldiphosphoundecaprenol N-acetyl-beta-D-mannosaminyltransferase